MRRRAVGLLLAAGLATPGAARAQEIMRDVLAGHVRGPRGPVDNGTVLVQIRSLAGSSRTQTARTDAEGRWLVAVQEGTGNYLVRAIAFGLKPAQAEARRGEPQKPIIVELRMEANPMSLDTVRVVVSTPRPRVTREVLAQDRAGSDRAVDGFVTAIATGDQGNLSAMAATVPGVLGLGDGGFSVLGLSSDQNRTTINGLSFGANDIPRDAIAGVRVASTSYDVSRGGFSGAQTSVTLAPGGNYHTRIAHVTLDDPSLQQTDATGRSLGSRYRNTQVSGALTGPIKVSKVFYNTSFQLGRRGSDLQRLSLDDGRTLERVGIVLDSATRALAASAAVGLPWATPLVPGQKLTDNAAALARFDWFRSPRVYMNLTASGRRNLARGSFLGPTATPGHGGTLLTSGADVLAAVSAFTSGGFLNDARVGLTRSRSSSDPYLDLPDVRLRVRSDLSDGSAANTTLQLGGNAALPRQSTNWGAQVYDVVSWQTRDRRHRFRTTLDARLEGLSLEQSANPRGTYTFNSLADFESNTPAVFTRSLSNPRAFSRSLAASLALGDELKPRDRTQVMYGLRVDANRFFDAPAPTLVDVSPRVGFFRAFGTNGTTGIPGFGAPWGNVRGGIGMFRNSVAPGLMVAPLLSQSGGAQLTCIGSAVPAPDWRAFAQDAASIPSTCVGGVSSYASSAPNASSIDKDFQAQRSWRANVALNAFLVPKLVRATVEGVYSLNLGQQSAMDLNFNPSARFSLAAEADRPVFVNAASIVPATGALTMRDSRLDGTLGVVSALTSDMRSDSRQLIFTVFPAPGDALGRFTQWNAAYSYQRIRDRGRGFGGGSTAGNPLDIEWTRGALDAHHQVTLNLSTRVGTAFSIATTARFMSGLPFTPVVGGDVNGDGLWNDRPFITDSTVAALAGAPTRVSRCLTRQEGAIAARNSCEGPWSGTMNAMLILNPERLGWQNRVQLSLGMTNVLSGFDQLLHGSSPHGWGQPATSDPTLLYVRGFDPGRQAFSYEVNPRFGDTRPSRSGIRVPFQLTLEARVQLGRDYTQQAIDQALMPGRTRKGNRLSFTDLKSALVTTVYNPVRGLVQAKDSLTILTNDQLRQLTLLDARVIRQQDSIVTPLARYLADLPDRYDNADVARRLHVVEQQLFETVIDGMRTAREIFTPEQINEFPPFLRASFDIKRLMSSRPTKGFDANY